MCTGRACAQGRSGGADGRACAGTGAGASVRVVQGRAQAGAHAPVLVPAPACGSCRPCVRRRTSGARARMLRCWLVRGRTSGASGRTARLRRRVCRCVQQRRRRVCACWAVRADTCRCGCGCSGGCVHVGCAAPTSRYDDLRACRCACVRSCTGIVGIADHYEKICVLHYVVVNEIDLECENAENAPK
ncbi:hypothetical protein GGX14DRAFT_426557 [Mycena pura]|uniref:Uncharacterized protein n=1 Tax=Mycena pura TaxID=153505 RepID=A0AAD6YNR0_9AGAR|nr:hypothetical protein GGX14DRAFT_426557 [Mycena pura]